MYGNVVNVCVSVAGEQAPESYKDVTQVVDTCKSDASFYFARGC